MGINPSRSEDEIFDCVPHEEPKEVAIIGPEKSGKTFIYETLIGMPKSKHYISTGLINESLTNINGQMFRIYDCPPNIMMNANAYIIVLGKDSGISYMDNILKDIKSTEIVFVSRFGHNLDGVIDVRYDPYTEITMSL